MRRLLAGAVLAPLLVGVLGALFERYGLRRVHKFGHVPELLFTFGLSLRDPRTGAADLGPRRCFSRRRAAGPAFTIVELPTGCAVCTPQVCTAARLHASRCTAPS